MGKVPALHEGLGRDNILAFSYYILSNEIGSQRILTLSSENLDK